MIVQSGRRKFYAKPRTARFDFSVVDERSSRERATYARAQGASGKADRGRPRTTRTDSRDLACDRGGKWRVTIFRAAIFTAAISRVEILERRAATLIRYRRRTKEMRAKCKGLKHFEDRRPPRVYLSPRRSRERRAERNANRGLFAPRSANSRDEG